MGCKLGFFMATGIHHVCYTGIFIPLNHEIFGKNTGIYQDTMGYNGI